VDAALVQSKSVGGIKHGVDIPECSIQEIGLTNAWFLCVANGRVNIF